LYQAIYYDKTKNSSAPYGTIFLWDDKHGLNKIPFRQYAYKKDQSGDTFSLTGVKLKKVSNWAQEDVNAGLMFESDVDPVMRTLIDKYYETDEVSVSHRKWVLDIEVSMEGGASSPEDANNEITAIGLKEIGSDKRYILILDKHELLKERNMGDTHVLPFNSELKLLNKFLSVFYEISPTIVTGWNVLEYDFTYLYNRIKNVMGKKFADKISPIGHVSERRTENDRQIYSFAGFSILDYMSLYKGFTQNEEVSYTLDAISRKELGRGKIEYLGSLDDLFREDVETFIKYNIEDCTLVSDLDEKLDFISLALTICHKGHVPYEDIVYTSRWLEGAALTYMKRVGVVSPNRKKAAKLIIGKHHTKGETKLIMHDNIPNEIPRLGRLKIFKTSTSVMEIDYIDVKDNCFILGTPLQDVADPSMAVKLNLLGAFVKVPIAGRYEWIYDLDLKSLYPSIIMTLNISPETKLGKILNWRAEDFIHGMDKEYIYYSNGKRKKMSHSELSEFLNTNKHSIAANGAIYRTDVRGFLPTILDVWFNERDESKTKMKEYRKKGDEQKARYYNLRQLAQKVMLNAFYGVLALQTFRFYDIDNASAVTETGRAIITYSSSMLNHFYNSTIGTTDKDYTIYIDTDSLFASALPIIKHRYPNIDVNDNEIMSKEILGITGEVQQYVNNAYDIYAKKMHNVDSHRLFIKQEVIGKAGFWAAAKKRYAVWVINKEGVPIDELDVKGMDVVRSDFPKSYRSFMTDVLWSILKFKPKSEVDDFIQEFKENLSKKELFDVMFPSGIHDIVKHDSKNRERFEILKGTPAHVKASLTYNDMISMKKCIDVEPIKNGDKIKWTYLKPNSLMLKTCALKGYKDPDFMIEFINTYIDHQKNFESKISQKIKDFYDALGWEQIISNENVTKFFDF